MKNNVSTFAKMKANGEKISMLTAYDYSTAKIMDNCVNGILVGDSLGNVMLGYEDTLSVTMEDMITFGSAVSRACKNAMVVVDMPFMSYEVSVEQAVMNAGRLMKEARANAVKLEVFSSCGFGFLGLGVFTCEPFISMNSLTFAGTYFAYRVSTDFSSSSLKSKSRCSIYIFTAFSFSSSYIMLTLVFFILILPPHILYSVSSATLSTLDR
mgnify:CR=1 FL=1